MNFQLADLLRLAVKVSILVHLGIFRYITTNLTMEMWTAANDHSAYGKAF